jgi:hypothetical protein
VNRPSSSFGPWSTSWPYSGDVTFNNVYNTRAVDSYEDEQNLCCKEENICEKVTKKASLKANFCMIASMPTSLDYSRGPARS